MKALQLFTENSNQFNERKSALKFKWLKKIRDSSFMEDIWGNLLISTFVLSLVFLIGMYFVQIFLWS
jgi:hypothetical protein